MTLCVVLFLLFILLNKRNISDRVSPFIPPSYPLSLYVSRKDFNDPSKIYPRLSAKLSLQESSNRLGSATAWSSVSSYVPRLVVHLSLDFIFYLCLKIKKALSVRLYEIGLNLDSIITLSNRAAKLISLS